MNGDKIVLHGLAFYAYHGVIPEENRLGQRFIVDVEMGVDTRAAGRTDELERTVDYAAVYNDVKQIIEGPTLRLLETLAEQIAAQILDAHPVHAVRVRVRKPDVPMPAILEYVGVEIERTRDG
ncbi:MAG: dihydroneopterin aldolase [Gemmatimonadaceae bacterium]